MSSNGGLRIAVDAISAGEGLGRAIGGMRVYFEGLLGALCERQDVERHGCGRRTARVGQRDADARELDAGPPRKLGEAVDDLGAGERRGRQDERDVDELSGIGELALRGEAGARDELGDARGGRAGEGPGGVGGRVDRRRRGL